MPIVIQSDKNPVIWYQGNSTVSPKQQPLPISVLALSHLKMAIDCFWIKTSA